MWNEALKPKEYAIDVLRKKGEELPEDVDPTKKEVKYSLINEYNDLPLNLQTTVC